MLKIDNKCDSIMILIQYPFVSKYVTGVLNMKYIFVWMIYEVRDFHFPLEGTWIIHVRVQVIQTMTREPRDTIELWSYRQ